MAFDFPTAPSAGTIYAPSGGPTYRWDGTVWSQIAQPFQGAFPSDTPPTNPVHGQLWWETDTGLLYVYYTDANSSQWVEVISSSMPDPPADGNEYVRVNGVWRLSRQSFDLAGLGSLDIPCPSWNPVTARIVTWAQDPVSQYQQLRVSGDGSTFAAGASDYTVNGGFTHSSGTNAFANNGPSSAAFLPVTASGDHPSISQNAEVLIKLVRYGSELCTWKAAGTSYNSNAVSLLIQNFYYGFVANTVTADRIRALRWLMNAGVATTGRLTVEWLP